jgi:thioredoxin 1
MKQISAAEFESQVLGSHEPVLVDFYTDLCPPCGSMTPVLQEMENEAEGHLRVVKIDAGREISLAASLMVSSVPAFFLFADGECRGQIMGARSKNSLKRWVEESIREQ